MERPYNPNEDIEKLISNVSKVIIGKREVIELVVTSILAKGHVLIEDVPGVGKTQMVSAIANSCGGIFNRIQLTPDVMPSDITGFNFLNPTTKEMEFRQGAAFCNFLLTDEINRASAKTQSALLEIMEENQVSIDGETYKLPTPFMVLATQNPVETSGTYHLPEAQMDRFLMKLSIGYPSKEDELSIFRRGEYEKPSALNEVISIEDINNLINCSSKVKCSEEIERYIIDICYTTRYNEGIKLGVSPRGSIALRKAAMAFALINGRDYCIPDDIKYLSPYVLAHRIILSPKGKSMWNDNISAIKAILSQINVL